MYFCVQNTYGILFSFCISQKVAKANGISSELQQWIDRNGTVKDIQHKIMSNNYDSYYFLLVVLYTQGKFLTQGNNSATGLNGISYWGLFWLCFGLMEM